MLNRTFSPTTLAVSVAPINTSASAMGRILETTRRLDSPA
jgi:hypothetical protein